MKKNKKTDPANLNGPSVYHTDRKTVYAPFFTKKAYIITPENMKQYVSYIQGYLVSIVVFVIAYLIYRKPLIPVILMVLFMVSTVAVFYFNFIRKAAVLDNFKKPEKEGFISRQAKALDYKRIWTVIIASPLLAIAIMIHSYLNKYEGAMLYIMVFMALLAAFYGILHIFVLLNKKHNEK